MAIRFRRKTKINPIRVGIKIGIAALGLWVSGLFLNIMGAAMNQSSSAFYKGLKLLGWKVETVTNSTLSPCYTDSCAGASCPSIPNCLTDPYAGAGLLPVIGLLAVVFIVTEFVTVSY